mmetsp:Transcript_26634/g.58511  ORF Transcript_26634/g.58511 Transcript_26634/m.58511 type:complete len:280 (-) Transcript_26634:70-909(-)
MGSNIARLVFQPPQPSYRKDQNLHWLHTELDEEIPAFYIAREGARFTLLFSHGNAEDLGLIIRYFREVSCKLRVNVFSYEYTGYGQSTCKGPMSEKAVYADIKAAFRYLRVALNTPWEQIIPYGRSIGTAPSIYLASLTAVRGVVLQSPMVSIYRIPFRLRFTLPGDVFSNIDKIGNVCCPVWIIHGTRDEIVPVWHGQGLHDVCVKKGTAYGAWVIEGADHNNLEHQCGESFNEHFKKYLTYLEQTPISEKLRHQANTMPSLLEMPEMRPQGRQPENT